VPEKKQRKLASWKIKKVLGLDAHAKLLVVVYYVIGGSGKAIAEVSENLLFQPVEIVNILSIPNVTVQPRVLQHSNNTILSNTTSTSRRCLVN
jgi:hypothetical protein